MGNDWRVRAATIVLLYTLGTIIIFIILARYFPVSDITGVGQLFSDVLLFPTIIIGFWIAITEFRKSQAVSDIKLRWQGDMAIDQERDSFVLKASKHNIKKYNLLLFVRNDGRAIATWYRLAFDVPRDLARPNSDMHVVRWHRGEESCWSSGSNMEMTRHEFKSNGQHALYPGEEIHIATLEVQIYPQISYPSRMYIRQSVVTDKTPIQDGLSRIKVRPEI